MKEGFRFRNLGPIFPENENEVEDENSLEKEKRAENFIEGVRSTLIWMLREKDNLPEEEKDKLLDKFSEYEKSLLEEGHLPKINMLVDIDGVLIDTESNIKNFIKILIQDAHISKNFQEAIGFCKKTKIPQASLKELLRCRDNTENITLVTDRIGIGPCCFPCFDNRGRKTLEDHEIDLHAGACKFLPMFSHEERFIPQIGEGDITYYFGSSNTDRKYVERIWNLMEERNIPREKLAYIHVEPRDRKNKL